MKDFKVGDKVRIIMCCYPNPTQYFLGKVAHIDLIYENSSYVLLKEYRYCVNTFFLEKVDESATDIEMELNENTIFNIKKV